MMHEGLWKQLLKLDPPQTATRARCKFLPDPDRHVVTLLNSDFTVDLADKQIFPTDSAEPAGFIEQLCILAYLINAKDSPIADKLVKLQSLPGGQFFFRGSAHQIPTDKLEDAFGLSPEKLYQFAERFNPKKCSFGDASIELNILPRVPLTIVIWAGDDEFPTRASALVDKTAADQLPLDALHAAVILAIKAIVKP